MLWRHSASYLLARGVPGLLSLAAIAVYTRLLGADEYGSYALIIAGVGLSNKLAFEWLRLALLRFRLACNDRPQVLDATITAAFLGLVCFTAALGVLAWVLTDDPNARQFLLAGIPLLWIQGLFDLELERARSELRPKRYGLMAVGRAALSLAFGVVLVWLGLGPFGLIFGLIGGMLIVLGWSLPKRLKDLRLRQRDRALMAEFCLYGGPLAVTGALSFMINSLDRFIIGWLLNGAAVGRYAVAYDLTSFALGLLLMIVNLAAFPLAIRALEEEGPAGARAQLEVSLTALLAIGLPATIGMVVLARPIAHVLLGAQFQDDAAMLIPLIAIGVLLRDLKAFYLDLAFQLGRSTIGQIWVALAALAVNFALNVWWIPRFGLVGAAYATIATYALAMILSALIGRRAFDLPRPSADSVKVALAALGMGAVVWLLGEHSGIAALVAQVSCGVLVYTLLIYAMDTAGVRVHTLRLFARWRQQGSP
jgi:O-antigen/teichoic acid export membrane protein